MPLPPLLRRQRPRRPARRRVTTWLLAAVHLLLALVLWRHADRLDGAQAAPTPTATSLGTPPGR